MIREYLDLGVGIAVAIVILLLIYNAPDDPPEGF